MNSYVSPVCGSIQRMTPNQSPLLHLSSSLRLSLTDLLASSFPFILLSRKMQLPKMSFLVGWVEQVLGLPFCFSSPTAKDNISTPSISLPSVLAPFLAAIPSILVFFQLFWLFVCPRFSLSLACLATTLVGKNRKTLDASIAGLLSIHEGGVNWQCGDRRAVNREWWERWVVKLCGLICCWMVRCF